MTIREGRWDCQYCGTTGLLGRDKVCPQCATSRPEGTRFYLPQEADEVASQALAAQAKIGPDWLCEYCRSSNRADASVCRHCNAAREETSQRQQVKTYGLGEAPGSGDMEPDVGGRRPEATAPPARGGQGRKLLPLIAGGVFFCFVAIFLLLSRTGDVEATVSSLPWERTIAVEVFTTVAEEDWSIPDGGRILDEREEIHHYNQVLVGYETRQRQVAEQVQVGQRTYVCGQRDLGNGFFEDVQCSDPVYETQYRSESYQEPLYEQVPVYEVLYTYEIDRWEIGYTERSGGDGGTPTWPDLFLDDGEREGERTEQYEAVFVDGNGKTYSLELSAAEWGTLEPNGRYKLKVNALGRAVEVVR